MLTLDDVWEQVVGEHDAEGDGGSTGLSVFPNLFKLLSVRFFSGGKACGVVNTTLHLRNGLNGSAVLHLSEPLVHVRCVDGCEFCCYLSSLSWFIILREKHTHTEPVLHIHITFCVGHPLRVQNILAFWSTSLVSLSLSLPSFSHCLSRPPTHTLQRTLSASCCCK